MEISNFPPIPTIDNHQNYVSEGKPNNVNISNNGNVNFSGLIGTNIHARLHDNSTIYPSHIITEAPLPKRKKRKSSTNKTTDAIVIDDESVDSKKIVENTVYSDTYLATNSMAYGIINQTDQLLQDCKNDLDFIRSRKVMKGRFHYINATMTSMSQLLATKLSAIKEINSTIKNVNDNEYRRFKDMRALDSTNDNKSIMDAYTAFISAPVEGPRYELPGVTALTGGLNGVIKAEYPANVQMEMDKGMNQYLQSLTPEENLMLNDYNKDIEEVIIYDQASGAKKFQWINTRTKEIIPNMPQSSELTIDDYIVDINTGIAKNKNLNSIKKVIIKNGSEFDGF